VLALCTRSFHVHARQVQHVAAVAPRTRNVDSNPTVRIQTRQSAARHKGTLIFCALLVVVGFVGWLLSL